MSEREARDLGNGTSVVFVPQEAINPTNEGANSPGEMNGLGQGGFYVISNTKAADGGRPFLRGPFETEAEAEAASLAVEWTADMLATEWPRV